MLFRNLRSCNKLSYKAWQLYVTELCAAKAESATAVQRLLVECGAPATNSTTVVARSGTVDRLTDTTKYGGTHKERFHTDGTGKGKVSANKKVVEKPHLNKSVTFCFQDKFFT